MYLLIKRDTSYPDNGSPRYASPDRAALQALADGNNAALEPNCWTEFSVREVPDLPIKGFTDTQMLEWLMRHTQGLEIGASLRHLGSRYVRVNYGAAEAQGVDGKFVPGRFIALGKTDREAISILMGGGGTRMGRHE